MTKNEIKYVTSLKQKKFREAENKFIIEGSHLLEEAFGSNYYYNKIEKIYVTRNFSNVKIDKFIKSENIPVEEVKDYEFERLSETKSPQGVLAVVQRHRHKQMAYNGDETILALDNINDPGNLGTIIRTAYWFNIDIILLSENSAEPFNSKVVRASQGALFNIPVIENVNLEKELAGLQGKEFDIHLTSLSAAVNLPDVKFKPSSTVFVFGNEANGITPALVNNPGYKKIKIPSYSDCESLNVAISAGIILYQYRSQK